MNSVYLFVRDAVGITYLDTFTANTEKEIASFRKHAEWWKRYVRSPEGRAKYAKTHKGNPCFPVEICVEPYQDNSQ